ncbi:MAG TPA: hypothetical protein VF472_12245 [Burkholderiaceae bacterium]
MNGIFSTFGVPSKSIDLLRSYVGKRILRLVRYSWWPAEEVASHCGTRDEQAFSLTAGPLAIYFEGGAILGLTSDPSRASVIVWDEAAQKASDGASALDQDKELCAIADSGRFAARGWRHFNGRTLSELAILKRAGKNAKEEARPREVGLRFRCDDGTSFVASHGLHDGTDDFSVLEESQLIDVKLEEIPIS